MVDYLPLLFLILSLAWCLVPAFLCATLARKKRRDPVLWCLPGLFCGWIGVAILAPGGLEERRKGRSRAGLSPRLEETLRPSTRIAPGPPIRP